MNTLYIERSTGDARNGEWTEKLLLEPRPERIVVGLGPGSFAGIRSALAFAQGYRLGCGCEVKGLPSPCALADGCPSLAVVGDARQGKFWLAVFEGFDLRGEIRQLDRDALAAEVPRTAVILSPDHRRIGSTLKEIFGDRYEGEALPTDAGLRRYAEARPDALVSEPLPIYLNPAVRSN